MYNTFINMGLKEADATKETIYFFKYHDYSENIK